jgi:hypothetical protein
MEDKLFWELETGDGTTTIIAWNIPAIVQRRSGFAYKRRSYFQGNGN